MYYTDFSTYMQRKFPGEKVQKISVNAGFSCPTAMAQSAQVDAYIAITLHSPPGIASDIRILPRNLMQEKIFLPGNTLR